MGDVAITIYNVAKGEGPEGRKAIKALIQNREHFSCPKCHQNHNMKRWRNEQTFHKYTTTPPKVPAAEQSIWRECKMLAGQTVEDNTGGATHFQRGCVNADNNNLQSHQQQQAQQQIEITLPSTSTISITTPTLKCSGLIWIGSIFDEKSYVNTAHIGRYFFAREKTEDTRH